MSTQTPLIKRADCGHQYNANPTGAAGYATDPSGATLCYACADDRQRMELTAARRVVAYLSEDGCELTTWTGGRLMTVTRTKTARVGFPEATGRRPVRYFLQATDVHGQIWRGTSPGPSMYARMRRN